MTDEMKYNNFVAEAVEILELSVGDRVAAGAVALDMKLPDWWERLRLVALEMSDSDACVLGQLYGDYFDGAGRLSGLFSFNEVKLYGYAHGFDSRTATDLGALGEEWQRVVLQRREAAARTVNELTEARLKGDAAAELAATLQGMDLRAIVGETRYQELIGSMPPEVFYGFSGGAEAIFTGIIRVLEEAAAAGRNGTWLP